ncbi:MAG: TolC family protein [Longimicrobiales bacterium]
MIVLCGVLITLVAGDVTAQQIPQRLTLEEAQRLAQLHNPEYRRAQNDLEVAAANVTRSYGSLLPEFSSSLGFGGSYSSYLTGTGDLGEVVRGDRVESQSSSASQGLSLSMTLFDGGANLRGVAAARANQRASDARLFASENLLRAQVSREYFAALRAMQLIALEERLLAARKDDLERTEKQLALVASKYVDVLSARVEVASAERSLDLARGNAEKARLTLKSTLGIEGPAEFSLTTEPPAIFDPLALDENGLVQRTLAGNPGVRAAEAAVRAAGQQASAARGSRWPQITGSIRYNRSARDTAFRAFGELNPSANRDFGFNISASLPLFTGFNTSYNIAQANVAQENARENLRSARLDAELQVRSALIDIRSAYRSVQLAERSAELSRERLTAAQEEYRLGASGMDFFRLQQYVQEEARTERELVDARFTFVTALANLEERLGSPLER